METKYTPGPWTVIENNAGIHVDSADGLVICRLKNCDKKHRYANASLIAAAPQLLEFAQFVIEKWGDDGYGGEFEDGESEVIDKARAVIAKATAT